MTLSIRYFIENVRKVPFWLRSSKDVRFYLNRALWESGFPWTKLMPEELNGIFPDIDLVEEKIPVMFPFARSRGTSIELDELFVVLLICRFIAARNILEIGTFDGNTAINLAVNIGDDGKVISVDLPSEETIDAPNNSLGKTTSSIVDRKYLKLSEWSKIEQVFGDSAEIDWSSLGGKFDLIFIDGDHSSEYVRSDTQNALRVLKHGGVILWHDYECTSVASVIDAAVRRNENDIHWVKGTRLAVGIFDFPEQVIERFNKAI